LSKAKYQESLESPEIADLSSHGHSGLAWDFQDLTFIDFRLGPQAHDMFTAENWQDLENEVLRTVLAEELDCL
jgi:hypothetical protein